MTTLENRPNTALLDGRQIVPGLKPDDAEPLVGKTYAEALEETILAAVRPRRRCDPGQRRAHERGPDRVGCPVT